MSNIATRTSTLLRCEPFAAAVGILFLAMTLPTLASFVVDTRTIAEASVWLKPLKFQLSFGIHVLTVALALGTLDRSIRQGPAVRTTLVVLLVMSMFEVGWITVQGARGSPSHFATTSFDFAMYVTMGIGATLILLATALLGILILRQRAHQGTLLVSQAVGIGLLISGVTGLITGWAISLNDGALVGSTNIAGPSIPLFGWSGTAGDLRVAHFFGLHAAQLLPLLGLALDNWKARDARPILLTASMLWSGATLTVLIQALCGRPFIFLD
jgi:hypothetical protein